MRITSITLILMLLTTSVFAQRQKPKETEVRGHTMYTLLKPGDIPAIFEPEFMSLEDAAEVYFEDEPLLVVVGDTEVKGYSTWHLDRHEIVNDYIDGKAITVTW